MRHNGEEAVCYGSAFLSSNLHLKSHDHAPLFLSRLREEEEEGLI